MLYEISEAKGSFLVMCYLEAHGSTTKYGLARRPKLSKEAIDHAVQVLERLGLWVSENSSQFPFARRIRITPQGEEFMSTPVRELPTFLWRNGQKLPVESQKESGAKRGSPS